MDLVLHIGLHKTGTTFIQMLCTLNRERLRQAGIHYGIDPHPGRSSAHLASWAALNGDPGPAAAMVQAAAADGARCALISSEDFTGFLCRPDMAPGFLQALYRAGASRITLVLFIRRQDAMFWSVYDTIGNSLMTDPLFMFFEAMRVGYYLIHDAARGFAMGPYYFYAFDYESYVGRLAGHLAAPLPELRLELWSFDDRRDSFPGEAWLRGLGILDCVELFPGEPLQNRRRPPEETAARFGDAFARVAGAEVGEQLRHLVESRALVGARQRELISTALMERYAPGNARLLQRFGTTDGLEDALPYLAAGQG